MFKVLFEIYVGDSLFNYFNCNDNMCGKKNKNDNIYIERNSTKKNFHNTFVLNRFISNLCCLNFFYYYLYVSNIYFNNL